MSKFRKKPVEIDAVCWNGYSNNLGLTTKPAMEDGARYELPGWLPAVSNVVPEGDGVNMSAIPAGAVWRQGDDLLIGTLEGAHRAIPGDWIIQGVKGELYPCKPDIFAATYEPAS